MNHTPADWLLLAIIKFIYPLKFKKCLKIQEGYGYSYYRGLNLVPANTLKAMTESITRMPITDIVLDEEIYPRERIDLKRVGIFAENIRDGADGMVDSP